MKMKPSKTRMWIKALRLRTLPLAWAGIIAGSSVAAAEGKFRWDIFAGALLTASLFQILSNLANDYGDGIKGTDNEQRQGPLRALQSGLISPAEMKKAVLLTALLSLLSAVILLWMAFGNVNLMFAVYLILAGAAIWAAIKYTVGRSAYGYVGLGDLFVLLFFGFVAVAGSYFLYTHRWDTDIVLPSLAIGFMSMAVLNINNIRDRETDILSGKKTIPVLIGLHNAFAYHRALLSGTMLALLYFGIKHNWAPWKFMVLIPPLILFLQSYSLQKNNSAPAYNRMLKNTALFTLWTALLFAAGNIF